MEGIIFLLAYMACGFFFAALYKLALDKELLDRGNDDFGNAIGIFLFWPLVTTVIGVMLVAILFLFPVLWLFRGDES